jgi:MFS family permease
MDKHRFEVTYERTITQLASLVFGLLGIGMLPTLITSFEQTYALSHEQMGTWLGLGVVLTAVTSMLLGAVADRTDSNRSVAGGMAVMALASGLVWLSDSTLGFITALLTFQAGAAYYSVLNAKVSCQYGAARGRAMNLLHGLQGVGRLLAPMLTALAITATASWRNMLVLSLFVHVLFACLFLRRTSTRSLRADDEGPRTVIRWREDWRRMARGIACFCFVAGGEASLVFWLVAYFETGAAFSPTQAQFSLAMVMIGYTTIRILTCLVPVPIGAVFMLAALSLNLLCCGVLPFAKVLTLAYPACVVLGFSFGTFWPSAASLMFDRLPGGRGTLSGIFILGSMAGSTVCLWLVGRLADALSLRVIFIVSPLCNAVFVALFLSFLRTPSPAGPDGTSGRP